MLTLHGSMTALITPFKNDSVDHVDRAALDALLEWQIASGTTAIVSVGTTGESSTLSHAEHEAIIEQTVKTVNKRIPVIAGTGSNSTAEAIRLTQQAAHVGADAALVVTPYYNKPTQRGLIEHFTALHNAADIPIIIYNIPSRSVIDMMPQTIAEVAKLPRVIGIKDATGDVVRVSEHRLLCGNDFIQLSGEDGSALGYNAQGGVGCISVTANVAPALCAEFQRATLAGDYARALVLHDRLLPLHKAVFLDPGVCGAKYALARLGKCAADVRLPLTPVSTATARAIDNAMHAAGINV